MKWNKYYEQYLYIVLMAIGIIFALFAFSKAIAHVDLIEPGLGIHREYDERQEEHENKHVPPPRDNRDYEKECVPKRDRNNERGKVWMG